MKKRKIVSLICAVMMLFALAVPAFAAETEIDSSVQQEIQPRSNVYTVPDYEFIVWYADGGTYVSPTYTKSLFVPNGSTYRQNSREYWYTEHNVMHDGKLAEYITYFRWTYDIIPK